jgi:hypothetical protein
MIIQLLAFIFYFTLTACSNVLPATLIANQFGGQGQLEEQAPPVTFHPNDKPANPASLIVQGQIFSTLKKGLRYIPQDAALFNAIIVGDRVHDIYNGGGDREAALNKLVPEGQAFLRDIKSKCLLNPAQKTESGRPKPGTSVNTSIKMSSSGTTCDYVIDKSIAKTVVYSNSDVDPNKGVYHWSENVSISMNEKRDVLTIFNDPQIFSNYHSPIASRVKLIISLRTWVLKSMRH